MILHDPQAMADLHLAVAQSVALFANSDGSYRRSDGKQVFTEEVRELLHRRLIRHAINDHRLELTLEGKHLAETRDREAMVALYSL